MRIPSEAEERVRDIVRLRETLQREVLKSRHYVLKFLARRGFIYREGKNWSQRHFVWLKKLQGTASALRSEDEFVFSEYLALLEYKLQRRDELDRMIEELALTPFLAMPVKHLQCFKGLAVQGSMVLQTKIVDWRRFEKASQFSAYIGLVPREDSSGPRERDEAQSLKPETATAVTSSSRQRGATSIGPISRPNSSGDRKECRHG